jgi:hypothetical protein
MSEEILKKITADEKLVWTARTHMATLVIRGETILAPIVGAEKFKEITENVYGEGGKIMFPMVKDAFNVPVEDAIGAADLIDVVTLVSMSPEFESERVEESPERTVVRTTKCPWMELYKEYKVDPKVIPCYEGHQAWGERGLKAINPKFTHKMTKGMPKGDQYCEYVIEFKK